MEILLKKYFWVVNLIVVAICAVFFGRAVSHAIEGSWLTGDDAARPGAGRHGPPPPPPKAHGKESDEIVKRNVFCSGCAPPPPPVDAPPGANSNDPQKTSLQLELVSTMVCPTDDAWSMAVIRDLSTKEKDPAMYNRGQSIAATGATLVKVVNKRAYIRNGGRLEYVEMEGAAPVATVASNVPPPPGPSADGLEVNPNQVKCSGNNCTVDRALVDNALKNTAMLATAARFVPSIKDGKPNGFKLYAIRPNSIFGLIGLQNGDTIKAINGMDMSSPDKALEVYTKLRNASHLSVQVERRGENTTLDYSIR